MGGFTKGREINVSEPTIHALAGAIGGSISLFMTYPMCLLSMRLQLRGGSVEFAKEASVSLEHKDSVIRFQNLWKRFVSLMLRVFHSVQKWYSGITSAVLAQLVIQYAYYYVYTHSRAFLAKIHMRPTVLSDFVCSSAAGLFAATASQPLWVVNTKKALDSANKSTFTLMYEVIRQDGTMSLFKGLLPSYFLVLNPIISYTVFETLKRLLLQPESSCSALLGRNDALQLSVRQIFLLSAVGKITATMITYPYMVARSMMQYGSYNKDSPRSKQPISRTGDTPFRCDRKLCFDAEKDDKFRENVTVLGAWRHIVMQDGYRGLYRGLESKIAQSVTNHALLFLFQDRFSRFFLNLLT